MMERFLCFKIIPVKLKMDIKSFRLYPFHTEVLGFWGFIFKLFKIETNKAEMYYRYTGNYFKGIYSYYKFRQGNKI